MASRTLSRSFSLFKGCAAESYRASYRKNAVPIPFRFASTTGNASASNTVPSTAKEVNVKEEIARKTGEAEPSSAEASVGETPRNYSGDGTRIDWSRSYSGLSVEPFAKEASDVLQAPLDPFDVEIKPDGLIYLPEIKYRRILNKAFGPGGWGLAPRSETNVGAKVVSREYALVCLGRLVAVARGEQEYFDPSGIPTATEACKSNALMRCCKDLGVASELWDPRFIREFKAKHCQTVFAEHATTKMKKKLYRRKDQPKFEYPWKE
ncbi:mitochondrial genome maintenance MGM101 [Phellopilus nigrolimitatus]|nr:mitochondrial genome maintenance MGM101 [Phellopilus nigrolimitatus]